MNPTTAATLRIAPGPEAAPLALKGLFRELGDLKRVRSAGREGSIASRAFRKAWSALAGGADPERVTLAASAAALASARLADLDRPLLASLGLSRAEIDAVMTRALDEVASGVEPELRARLRQGLGVELPVGEAPAFVDALEAQPRAGVTCPGKPRIVLEPPENHADHSFVVGLYGVLLSPVYGADATVVFLAGLSHHLHNAAMPDAGFTGEMLLGDHLSRVMEAATERALDQLDPGLRPRIEAAQKVLADAGTPEGRAFHAADVIDRVLQISQHLQAASLTMDQVLGDMALVHDGPVKPFHDRVLREMELA